MKCRYGVNCKHGGEVDKEKAIKVGSSYYHKECIKEKENKKSIEDYYVENMPAASIQIIRKVIKQLIQNGKDSEYILFVLKFIHINKKPINNPFGLINYCNDKRMEDKYIREKSKNEFKLIKDEVYRLDNNDDKIVVFKYTEIKKKGII